MAGGSFFGSIISAFLSDRIGRRDTLFVACLHWLVGSTLMSASQNVAMLIISRVINGLAVGMLTSQGPTYIAEISPASKRGRLICIQQWMITWGVSSAVLPYRTKSLTRGAGACYVFHPIRMLLHQEQHSVSSTLGYPDVSSRHTHVCSSFHASISSLACLERSMGGSDRCSRKSSWQR